MATANPTRRPQPLTASDVMTPAPRTCSPFSSVLEAVMVFRDADCGAVPVVEDGKPVGIVTDRDVALALAVYPDLTGHPVADVMTRGVISVAPDTPLEEAARQFGGQGVRRLLVVDASDQLLGIIAWADVSPYLPDSRVGRVVSDVVEQP